MSLKLDTAFCLSSVIETAPTPLRRSGRGRRVSVAALAGFLLISVACEPSVDVTRALRVTDMTTGWLDTSGSESAQNKLVPTISFSLDNVSEHELGSLQVQGMFHRAGEEEAWGSAFVRVVGREGLVSGASDGPFTLRSERGYTGEQTGREMLDHKDFVDVTVELFVKHRSAQWVSFSQYQIERQLIAE